MYLLIAKSCVSNFYFICLLQKRIDFYFHLIQFYYYNSRIRLIYHEVFTGTRRLSTTEIRGGGDGSGSCMEYVNMNSANSIKELPNGFLKSLNGSLLQLFSFVCVWASWPHLASFFNILSTNFFIFSLFLPLIFIHDFISAPLFFRFLYSDMPKSNQQFQTKSMGRFK